jgi:hypothetical protein
MTCLGLRILCNLNKRYIHNKCASGLTRRSSSSRYSRSDAYGKNIGTQKTRIQQGFAYNAQQARLVQMNESQPEAACT